MRKLLIVTGPTATGKTQLGIDLAKDFSGEIVLADSQQVYKGNDVETGKDKELYSQAGVKVWGLDLVEPGKDFNVAAFVRFTHQAIANLHRQGKLPIVVGGSGFYLRALLDPFSTINVPPDSALRSQNLSLKELQKRVQEQTLEKWQQMNSSDRQNPRRLIRVLEVAQQGYVAPRKEPYDALIVGLTAPRKFLYQKIVERRSSRPDLVEKEFQLTKKQLLYQKKYLPATWFDITDPAFHNKVWKFVAKFLVLRTNRRKSTPTT